MRQAFRSSLIGLALLAAPVAHAQSVPDAARVTAARPVVDKIFPVGTYRRMMDGTLPKMMDSMMDGVMKMPIAQLARIGGVPEEKLAGWTKARWSRSARSSIPIFVSARSWAWMR